MSRHIAIIGGGYSGTLQAIQLLRHGTGRVTLIDRGERVARGAAYSTRHADHLLNVRAAKMSAFADAPDDFANWLTAKGRGDGDSFAQRRVYGTYLEELLEAAAHDAGERLTIVKDDALSVEKGADCERVILAKGGEVDADIVIVSIGNLPPDPLRVIAADLDPGVYVADPWAGDIATDLRESDTVLLIGTGLTAIDAALMLDAAGFAGRILAVSRRGLVPRAHDRAPHAVPPAGRPQGGLGDWLRAVREAAQSIGWPSAVDQLRPHTQGMWGDAPVAERRRFLRHLRPYWDVHRHRIAPEIADRIAGMEAQGRLEWRAGKLVSTAPAVGGAEVVWRPRGGDNTERLVVRRIVNCTGPQGDLGRAREPLLAQLVESGRLRADPCRIGIDVDGQCRTIDANGTASDTLYAIGPMTRGAYWEIVAVPDLRGQVDALARRLS